MIHAEILDATGNLIYTVKFYGFEFALGVILAGITAGVIWNVLKRSV